MFGLLAYKRWSPLHIRPFIFLLLCIVTDIPILETMLRPYMVSVVGFISIKGNFLVFFLGAIFRAIYEQRHVAVSIANWMGGLTRGKFVLPVIMTIIGTLCYGGVLSFVVYFAKKPT